MKILIKMPTRGRPEKFFKLLDICIQKFSKDNTYQILVSCDVDDLSMNDNDVRNKLDSYNSLSYFFSPRGSKIEACNRDIEKANYWDVVILLSDDMMIVADNWDKYISDGFAEYFPDTDGVIWLFDGHRDDINTLCILGNLYYKRFGYIYHTDYKSFYCDNEFTNVANILNKQQKYKWPEIIIEHQHYSFSPNFIKLPKHVKKTNPLFGADVTYIENRPDLKHDIEVFNKRQEVNYGL